MFTSIFLFSGLQASAFHFCPSSEFQLWRGHCYSFNPDVKVNWAIARESCLNKSTGGTKVDLVSIHSAEENAYLVANMISEGRDYWIGFYRALDGKCL